MLEGLFWTVLTGVLWGFGFAAGWFLLQRLIQRYRKPGSGIRYIWRR